MRLGNYGEAFMEKLIHFSREYKTDIVRIWYKEHYVYFTEYQMRKQDPCVRREVEEGANLLLTSLLDHHFLVTKKSIRRFRRFGAERALFSTSLPSLEQLCFSFFDFVNSFIRKAVIQGRLFLTEEEQMLFTRLLKQVSYVAVEHMIIGYADFHLKNIYSEENTNYE